MFPSAAPVTGWVVIGISALALVLGLFNFYWTHIRMRRALYFVRVSGFGLFPTPQFALINAGDTEVLVTGIECEFLNAGGTGSTTPDQSFLINGGRDRVIEKGKAGHCLVNLQMKFDGPFALEGAKAEQGNRTVYCRDMKVVIHWVDGKGSVHTAEVPFEQYRLTETGQIIGGRSILPHQKRIDLYKSGTKIAG
jgi:hypothetical protein